MADQPTKDCDRTWRHWRQEKAGPYSLGPWHWDGNFDGIDGVTGLLDAEQDAVIDIWPHVDIENGNLRVTLDVNHGNMKLIAAAPELVAATEIALKVLTDLQVYRGRLPQDISQDLLGAQVLCREAVELAGGRTDGVLPSWFREEKPQKNEG